jgi:Domain of unknown function (DUF4190)
MPLNPGVASCPHCGATVGTLFSEGGIPAVVTKGTRQRQVSEHVDLHHRIEKAQERANNSVILGLTSFLPFIGLIMGLAAIVLAAMAVRTLRAQNVEDGRGSAAAGLVIGVLGLIAQGGYVVYLIKSGNPIAG